MIILGIVAIATPFSTSIVLGVFLGWLFVIGGIFQAISSLRYMFISIPDFVAGIVLITNPFAAFQQSSLRWQLVRYSLEIEAIVGGICV
jgi:uncharacterized membrane protein HdeD (DUF308 family)